MTNKRNKNLPCLMVMAAMLLSAYSAGGPQAINYWTANAERSGVVHAGNGREAVVLCMQGRKVVMQVQVDRAAGFSYKARFFHVDPDLTMKGRVMAEVGGDSNPSLRVNGRPLRCDLPSSVAFDGMLTVVYPESDGIVPARTVYPSLRNPVIVDEWQLRNATDKPLTVDFSMPGKVKTATEKTVLVWTRQGPASTVVEPGGAVSMVSCLRAQSKDGPDTNLSVDVAAEHAARRALAEAAWRGLPGFVPGPMADDWSETDCDFTLTRKAIGFIDGHLEKNPKNPFFLVLSTSSPHNPFLVPEAMKGKNQAGPRGDLVTVVDWAVGQIAEHLAKLGLANETLLIVTSDNGAVRGENGHKSENDFWENKASVYEGGHRIPFIARWPGKIRPGTTSSETISLIDFFATCAALTRTALPDDAGEDSRNVLPAILGQPGGRPLHEAMIFDSGNGEFSVRQGRGKAVAGTLDSLKAISADTKSGQLYDLDEDPGEKNDLWAKHPDIAKSMIELLIKYRAEGRSRPLPFEERVNGVR
jgi:hypothetical protein